jgi:hypothetical protein
VTERARRAAPAWQRDQQSICYHCTTTMLQMNLNMIHRRLKRKSVAKVFQGDGDSGCVGGGGGVGGAGAGGGDAAM